MIVRNLENISLEEILDAFLLAFENYFVPMPVEKEYYENRWKVAGVDYSLSYGMFDGGKLVGFIIHAVDKRQGQLTAFNTGTGVIPEYRGKRIVHSIYDQALKDLRHHGIEKSTLEVITKNEIAIRTYQKVGFNVYKYFKCFNGTLKLDPTELPEIREVDLKDVDWDSLPDQELYSWDNQKESVSRGPYRFFNVMRQEKPETFFVINPDLGYLAQFGLLHAENGSWERLFAAIQQISKSIKINNVDARLEDKVSHLSLFGLENSIDQYEMELIL